MASRCLRILKTIRCSSMNTSFSGNIVRHNLMSTLNVTDKTSIREKKDFREENKMIFLDDPDTFGTLSRKTFSQRIELDEGDIKEEKYLEDLPLNSQKLTTKQYADIIKQFVKLKRIKEAIDVLEVRMLQEDRVKPENYIYNILIGACADVGYTKKAFKLYNDMKKRALKPTGDTYTCLFTACLNSPWTTDGLTRAKHLRELMIEKGIEPNLTNYNVMIKTFGRCGDLSTAFKIVDEMISKKIKIRVHTFNHLLQACITDKENGLRHALIVWRKMLKMREKPNVYSFNLMLKCVKDCNLGSKEDINELIGILEENMVMNFLRVQKQFLQIESAPVEALPAAQNLLNRPHIADDSTNLPKSNDIKHHNIKSNQKETEDNALSMVDNKVRTTDDHNQITLELVDNKKQLTQIHDKRTVPNLLSRNLQMEHVFALQDVQTLQDKFAVIGGQDDFLKEMEVYTVKPDIKIFTQMLPLIDDSIEAEIKLIEAMKNANVKADIDFYNLLIRKRCMRSDYDKAFEVKEMIEKERKKRHPFNRKQKLKENIMTYGVLALACRTKESAEKLLNDMKENQVKVNIQILGTLLKHGTVNTHFDYIKYVMNVVKTEEVMVNDIFLQHLKSFNDKCSSIIKKNEETGKDNTGLIIANRNFLHYYKKWLTEVNVKEALHTEHPWQQFREAYPDTVQRTNNEIKIPKKFYKRNRKYVMYAPQVK